MTYFFRLGKNANLSYAELISYLDAAGFEYEVVDVNTQIALIEIDTEIDAELVLNQLGGTTKIGRVIGKTEKLGKLETLEEIILSHLGTKEGKKFFGISKIGKIGKMDTKKLGLDIKKNLEGSARFVTSRDQELSSVIVKNEKLLTHGGDFNIMSVDSRTYIGVTAAVQDFKAYEFRDRGRPKVDPKSGMLPPKLCQIMINLAQVDSTATVWDPHCGSGTMIQELLLKGFARVIGSDISGKAIDDSQANLEWLGEQYKLNLDSVELFNVDVRQMSQHIDSVDAIVTEPFLGPPLRGGEKRSQIESIRKDLEELYMKTFKTYAKILKDGGVVVTVFPVFKYKNEFIYIDVFNKLKSYGFTLQTQFKNLEDRRFRNPLMYYREDQKVYREILVFRKS